MLRSTADEQTIQQLFDLTGKVALITGASGHLGSSMSRALAEAGAAVVASSRDIDKAREFAKSLPSPTGAQHQGVSLSHMDAGSVDQGFNDAIAATGRVDILFNNGHEAIGKDLTDITPEEFSRHLMNATGYFQLARLVHDHAKQRSGPASIIMIGSMYGVVGSYPDAYEGVSVASPVAYHALKGGIVQMTRHLAVYWAKAGVRVNCLSPGPFPGEKAPAVVVERLTAKSPMGRIGKPHELKGAVVFLASDASSYITGQNLLVDGGWTSW